MKRPIRDVASASRPDHPINAHILEYQRDGSYENFMKIADLTTANMNRGGHKFDRQEDDGVIGYQSVDLAMVFRRQKPIAMLQGSLPDFFGMLGLKVITIDR